MATRDFSDSTKLEIVKRNLEKNNGSIQCESCNKRIFSISECHFDHIFPYAKGGKSVVENCQILCQECNLKKNDKLLKDFMLEEKAKQFLHGETIDEAQDTVKLNEVVPSKSMMSKDDFDACIASFIEKKGDIHKVDFGREYNHLPSIHYVYQYYGDLKSLKIAFEIENIPQEWNRGSIKRALEEYVASEGGITQKDLTKANKLPSLPCILKYYPEYANFSEIKRSMLEMDVNPQWSIENAIEAGRRFLVDHDGITQKDLTAENGLPSLKVINRLFGTLAEYQKAVGASITHKNDLITKEEIRSELDRFFDGNSREIISQKDFFNSFKYSPSTIYKRYSSFDNFCEEENITVRNRKKAKYTKREVDDAISNWVKMGNNIPKMRDLARLGLPSQSVILRFYEDWKEPFELYKSLYDEVKRV